MKKFKRFFNIFIIALLCLNTSPNFNYIQIPGSSALSKYGSVSNEVQQIQTTLKNLGYYTGKIDSVYGPLTRSAVINYQKSQGLTADGIAGPKTLTALGLYSSNLNKFTSSEINLIARIISAEARGESYTGQVAIGAVILNRLEHPSFPNTISGIIYQPGAFSCITDGQIYASVSDTAKKAAQDAINGWDPCGGAIYYYNPSKTSNKFMLSRPVTTVIGNHVFCK